MKKMVCLLKKAYWSIMSNIPRFFVHPISQDYLNKTNWIHRLSRIYYRIIKIYPSYNARAYLENYLNAISSLVAIDSDNKQKIIRLWMRDFSTSSDCDRYFMIMLFFESGLLSDEVSKMIMDYGFETEDLTRSYCVVMEASIKYFHWANGFYPEFYNDRKRILKRIASKTLYRPQYLKKVDTYKKLCIVVYMLAPNLFNSVQRVASMIANNLCNYYDKILVVSLETFCLSNKEQKSEFYTYKTKYSKNFIKEIESLFDEKVEVFIPENMTFESKNQQVLDKIYDFNPNSIIDISDEMSASSYIYSKDYPVYYIPLRSNASSVNFTYILGRRWKYEEGNKKFNSIDIKKVKEWMFPEYVPERVKDYSKKEIGVTEDSFIIVSIGNNDKTYSNHFLDLMCKLLDENPKIIWLLVGNGASSYIKEKYSNLLSSKRIIEWGFEKNLTGLCAACDAHIRPNMTGGSGATAIACQNGLPVVMTDFVCDPMRWLGRNYSSLHTEEDMITELKKLYMDSTYYNLQRERVLQLVSKATNSKYWWNKLFEILSTTGSVEE